MHGAKCVFLVHVTEIVLWILLNIRSEWKLSEIEIFGAVLKTEMVTSIYIHQNSYHLILCWWVSFFGCFLQFFRVYKSLTLIKYKFIFIKIKKERHCGMAKYKTPNICYFLCLNYRKKCQRMYENEKI